MNKKAWLAAALEKIDSMSREEFLGAMQRCGALDTNLKEVEIVESEELTFVINNHAMVDALTKTAWETDVFQMEEDYRMFASITAPQEALSHFLAA